MQVGLVNHGLARGAVLALGELLYLLERGPEVLALCRIGEGHDQTGLVVVLANERTFQSPEHFFLGKILVALLKHFHEALAGDHALERPGQAFLLLGLGLGFQLSSQEL